MNKTQKINILLNELQRYTDYKLTVYFDKDAFTYALLGNATKVLYATRGVKFFMEGLEALIKWEKYKRE